MRLAPQLTQRLSSVPPPNSSAHRGAERWAGRCPSIKTELILVRGFNAQSSRRVCCLAAARQTEDVGPQPPSLWRTGCRPQSRVLMPSPSLLPRLCMCVRDKMELLQREEPAVQVVKGKVGPRAAGPGAREGANRTEEKTGHPADIS